MLFLLVFILISLSQCDLQNQNCSGYHERQVYYSEFENVCQYGETSDLLNLEIIFDDRETKKIVIDTALLCEPLGLYSFRVHYLDWFEAGLISEGFKNLIRMSQEITKHRIYEVVYAITSKIKVIENKAIFYGKQYECKFIGNSKIEHFGPYTHDGKEYPMPSPKIECKNGKKI